MFIVTVDIDKCEACGDCVDTCPNESFELVEDNGRTYAQFNDNEECIGCESCVAVCPTEAITLMEM
jgi:NAD-dependent dihydropyrimidine dehydrogenase PreA subunit